MNKLREIKIIKEHSAVQFEKEVFMYCNDQQHAGKECYIQFAPILHTDGKPIYMAMIEVRAQ